MSTLDVDAIYCLTLFDRPERQAAFDQQMVACGLQDRYQLLYSHKLADIAPGAAANPVKAGDLGCAAAHRGAVEHAARLGYDRILVFEDDAIVSPHFDVDKINALITEFVYARGEVLNLGGCNPEWRPGTARMLAERVGESLFAVRNMVSTHAIIYTSRAYDRLLLEIPSLEELKSLFSNTIMTGAFDQWLHSEEVHTGDYPYFYQDVVSTPSDILGMPHTVDLIKLINDTYTLLRTKTKSA